MNKIILRIILFLFITAFFLKGLYVLDPDFGWHLRMGQEIFTSGIPTHDPFSFTMTRYPFVDHEWLTNVLIYLVHNTTGMAGVSALFTGAFFVTILILTREGKNSLLEILLLVVVSLLGFGGVRPQVLGWLLLVLWMGELAKTKYDNGHLLLLQLLWVNMHGSFFLGIATYIILKIVELFQKKKNRTSFLMISLLFCATLVNPYTYRIWWEVFMQLTDGSLRWRVMEWLPGILIFDVSFWVYSCIFFSLFIKFHKTIPAFQKTIVILFFLMALSTARNMSLFLLVSSAPFFVLWRVFERSVPKQKTGLFLLFRRVVIGICVFVSFASVCLYFVLYKPIDRAYPVRTVEYMQSQKLSGNTFSLYEWGGYLIWKLPDNKIFVDGRMPSWRWVQKDAHQSNNADSEYRSILKTKNNFDHYKQKYSIKYILVDKKKNKQLSFEKYKKIYEDETSVLYEL